ILRGISAATVCSVCEAGITASSPRTVCSTGTIDDGAFLLADHALRAFAPCCDARLRVIRRRGEARGFSGGNYAIRSKVRALPETNSRTEPLTLERRCRELSLRRAWHRTLCGTGRVETRVRLSPVARSPQVSPRRGHRHPPSNRKW